MTIRSQTGYAVRNLNISTNMWKLNSTIPNNQWVKVEIKGNQTLTNMKHSIPKCMDAGKAVLRGKFIVNETLH